MAENSMIADAWMYPSYPADTRYHEDSEFRMLVDLLTDVIWRNHYSPSELRQAAWLASMQYENMNIRRMHHVIEQNMGRPRKPCPCGNGWDDDGDGNCMVCAKKGKLS